ncbi:hypothetical protein RRG08_022859 [Elysia crispata]|uniref:Uncharacterized protein n=1 Tax=Elysia crispata TaxID=231223 RepID=A0AAE1D7V8_9GAST|nr:hypothetical protein RRG08_022859 [Elysia crispata]
MVVLQTSLTATILTGLQDYQYPNRSSSKDSRPLKIFLWSDWSKPNIYSFTKGPVRVSFPLFKANKIRLRINVCNAGFVAPRLGVILRHAVKNRGEQSGNKSDVNEVRSTRRHNVYVFPHRAKQQKVETTRKRQLVLVARDVEDAHVLMVYGCRVNTSTAPCPGSGQSTDHRKEPEVFVISSLPHFAQKFEDRQII